MVQHTFPKYPEYENELRRIASFEDWPRGLRQNPNEMAEIGYFYTGESDIVICFVCGLGLTKWETTDSPYEEHVKWNRECEFLKNLKDKDYLNNKVNKNSDILSRKNNLSNLINKSNMMCVICLDRDYNCVFLPCGHLSCCIRCALLINHCPICNHKIHKTTRVYFS